VRWGGGDVDRYTALGECLGVAVDGPIALTFKIHVFTRKLLATINIDALFLHSMPRMSQRKERYAVSKETNAIHTKETYEYLESP
jgi:hypothetical protein